MTDRKRVVVLGCGYAGAAVARLARAHGHQVLTQVRSAARAAALRAEGFEVREVPAIDDAFVTALAVDEDTHVVIAFPPDGVTDARLGPQLARAGAITYVSSTGVYGDHRGVVDDLTPVAHASERAAKILAAEQAYRASSATVLRCPGIYGPDRGLHVRMLKGEHRIPGDGTRHLSRIHIEDLAQLVLASGAAAEARGETYVVGDAEPAAQIDVVRFIAESYRLPLPPHVPLESVHESLRADRRVDASRVLGALGVTLRHPSYREGMAPAATGMLPRP